MSMGGMPWPQTGATHYHVQLGLQDKDRKMKGLVIFYSWGVGLLNGLALGCCQWSPKVWKKEEEKI